MSIGSRHPRGIFQKRGVLIILNEKIHIIS